MESRYYSKIKNQGYYLIAEIGVNYYEIAEKENLSYLDAAKLMIRRAAESGADAVKFQTYKAESLAMKDSPGSWDRNDISVETQFELFQLYDKLNEDDYQQLSVYAAQTGIEFISTPFDIESAEYLNKFMQVYKISSSDISNIPLITCIAKKNKPIILSVGASNMAEIDAAVSLIQKYNGKQLTLLHCVLEYPTPYEHANLLKIIALKERYPQMIIGYSDHTKPDACMDVLKTAYLLGAQVIEKHFTLDKSIKKKNDHFHSMDCTDLATAKKGIDLITLLKGSAELKCLESEIETRNSVRRSAVAKVDIRKDEVLTEDMIIFKRPATGISPLEITKLIGKKAIIDIAADTLLRKEQFV